MRVRWHGKLSESRNLPGGGAMGASLGNWEFLSQTNNNADCVPEEDRFKFVDDLTIIEVINMLTVGLSSFYMKHQVPNDIPEHGQFIEYSKLKSQDYLNMINEWTNKQKMIISQKKTKAMIINFTDNHQFTTRLQLKGENIEVVNQMKILGTIIKDDFSWDDNCALIIKKVNARMQLLRSVLTFGASTEEMVHLWTVFCRSVLEQSCVVWHGTLTQENTDDLERTQKTFCKLILREKYQTYENSLLLLNLDSLKERRKVLTLKFAKSGIKNNKMNDLLPLTDKIHDMKTRKNEKYRVDFANTERLKNASIITMQNMLNENENEQCRLRNCG